jgi:single-strand DNA-binding protein
MNLIQIAGNLGADPEVRYTPDGKKVITFRVATTSRRKGQEETIWWRVTIWEDRAAAYEKMLPYLKKGSAVLVWGELKPGIWTDKEGRPQMSLEITAEMIKFSPFGKPDSAKQAQGAPAYQPQGMAYAQPAATSNYQENGFGGGGFTEPSAGYQPSNYQQPSYTPNANDDVPF